MNTAARVHSSNAAHFYTPAGEPMHWIERSDGQGTRPTTLRDARKLGFLPSPTSILKLLSAPQLESWRIEQACLAVLTAPRLAGEDLDAFVKRVLHVERQQDEQARIARDLGTDIHAGVQQMLAGHSCPAGLDGYVMPAVERMREFGQVQATESVVVGDRCAGRLDALFYVRGPEAKWTVVDVKTTGNPPTKGSWPEHKLQLSFYARSVPGLAGQTVQTANVYISTKDQGVVVVDVHTDWVDTYERGFLPLLNFWYFSNNYSLPTQAASV